MAMAERWGMITGGMIMDDRLALAQMLSPAFPVGAYAYSQGLEQAMVDGAVTDAASLTDWVTAVLRHGAGRMDAIFLAEARRGGDLAALDALALAYAPCAERAGEMRDQGAAFANVLTAIRGAAQPVLSYAVGFGHATREMRLSTEEVLSLWLQALAAQLISAAVRFVPLGGGEGQAVLARLAPVIAEVAKSCAGLGITDLGSAAFGADLAMMRHETLEVRIFRT